MSITQTNPYKNRWVAVIRNRVVGVGYNATQAYQTAKSIRPKERPHLFFINHDGLACMQPDSFNIWLEHPLLKKIIQIWRHQNQEAYLVGGAVRDGLLGELAFETDLDFVVPTNALKVARQLANALGAAYYPMDVEREVGRVVLPDYRHLDISVYRGETLLEDLQHRDFTINAMALSLNPTAPLIIDPCEGQKDLNQKVIRLVRTTAFQADPLRTLRGVRLAAKFGFSLTPETKALTTTYAPHLHTVSVERVRDEFLNLINTPRAGQAITDLQQMGLLNQVLPEISTLQGVNQSPPHHLPVFEHTLVALNYWPEFTRLDDSTVSNGPTLATLAPFKEQLTTYFQTQLSGNLARADLMPLAALLHDIGKPDTYSQGSDGRIHFWRHPQLGADIARNILNRWRFSSQAIRFVVDIVTYHMRPLLLAHQGQVTRRAIHRFLEATGDAAPAIALFALSDHLATYSPGQGQIAWHNLFAVTLTIIQAYFIPKPAPLLTGQDVMTTLNLEPGPIIGKILRKLKEAQAIGQVVNQEDALSFIKQEF